MPFLFPGSKPLNVAAKICVYALLVASYDLLIGFTGIVSFAHTMFSSGIGSYGVAIALYGLGPGYPAIFVGVLAGLAAAAVLAFVIGLIFAARADDFLRHGDAGGRLRLRRARLAAQLADRRRGRAHVPDLAEACARVSNCSTIRCSAWRSTADCSPITCCS